MLICEVRVGSVFLLFHVNCTSVVGILIYLWRPPLSLIGSCSDLYVRDVAFVKMVNFTCFQYSIDALSGNWYIFICL